MAQQQLTPEQMEEKLASMSPDEIKEMQKQQCPFCQIIIGKIPARKIYEDDKVIALLDINPAAPGHVLLMPKEHYPILPFVPEEIIVDLVKLITFISKAFLKRLLVKGTNVFIANGAAAGQQVQHFLIHVIPREDGDGIDVFSLPEKEESPVEISHSLSPSLYAAMRDFTEKYPTGKKIPEAPKPTQEQLLQLVEQNPQLKELILKQPDQFRQLTKTHPQLQALFREVDIEVFIKKVIGKKEDKVDLDAVSKLLDESEKQELKENKEEIEERLPEKNEKLKEKNLEDTKREVTKKEKERPREEKDRANKERSDVDLDKVLDLLGGN